jgi:uncharacterized protein YijF (DUF1287 family)
MPPTPARVLGSGILAIAAISAAYAQPARPAHKAETCLGVSDKGIWSDLDEQLQLTLPGGLSAARVSATIDRDRKLMIVSVDGWPRKPYPYPLRDGDKAELAGLVTDANTTFAATPAARDRDHDGIPDALDVLMGAHKTRLNADAYTEGYVTMTYPMGDVPREMGVCTDVIVRALRNAGLDLQAAVHQDIKRAPRAYPMVKGKGSASIDHRRVKTILPWFKRNMDQRSAKLDDPDDPLRPGDIVFMDTFPSKTGPDHIGIVSDRIGDDGLPVVINNWTNGTVTAEMDLLGWVPVTHRFRMR